MDIIISCGQRRLRCGALELPVRIGKAGFVDGAQGREGDSKTPLGTYKLRWGFYRADRLPAPRSQLTFRAIEPDDGWCDESGHPAYNRFVKLPCASRYRPIISPRFYLSFTRGKTCKLQHDRFQYSQGRQGGFHRFGRRHVQGGPRRRQPL